ncbi:hypothetical protein F441_22124 [Phytophthora nicotianae CJ01A1]|nr:hypothetical protein F441_22124 [Phytophthora nicotianae CJ01A1]
MIFSLTKPWLACTQSLDDKFWCCRPVPLDAYVLAKFHGAVGPEVEQKELQMYMLEAQTSWTAAWIAGCLEKRRLSLTLILQSLQERDEDWSSEYADETLASIERFAPEAMTASD